MNFGFVIKQLRKQKGISQQRLADSAGITCRYYSEIERGDSVPSLKVISSLAKALDTTFVSLVIATANEPENECKKVILDTIKTLAVKL